jgi:hypothetical protein
MITKSIGEQFLDWAIGIFGPVAADRHERAMRFVEEAIEVAHAEGVLEIALGNMIERVYTRKPGDIAREIGQASATLEMLAASIGVSASDEAAREFARVQRLPKEHWQKRHAAKVVLGIAK